MKFKLSIKEDPFFESFINTLKKAHNIKKNDKIVVGVSGGVDSVALIHLLASIGKYKLIIAHVNHNLRDNSYVDQNFVEDLASRLKIHFYCKILDPLKKKKNISNEDWGRSERYTFFDKILHKTRADFISTAHHGNDQIETLLINLNRKTGNAGLRGIAHERKKIIRPLLNFNKKEISDFVRRNKIKYIEDTSNRDLSIQRNYIRREVIRPWEDQYPDIVKKISYSIKLFNEWHSSLDFLITKYILPQIEKSKNKFKIKSSLIIDMPLTLQVRLLEILINDHSIRFSKHNYKMIDYFINKPRVGNKYDIYNKWELRHERNYLVGYQKVKNILSAPLNLSLNRPVHVNGYTFEICLERKIKRKQYRVFNEELVDFDKLQNKIISLRPWKKGDSFIPLGMSGRQKVSDFLINQKTEQYYKERQYVMTTDNEIIWVCGMRLSNTFKIGKNTKNKAFLIQRTK